MFRVPPKHPGEGEFPLTVNILRHDPYVDRAGTEYDPRRLIARPSCRVVGTGGQHRATSRRHGQQQRPPP
jgi:hypothetical protein